MNVSTISMLPDYGSLKKLAEALWRQDGAYHGAAIMVGSGFSRCAASTGDTNKRMPLWNDFSKIISKELKSDSMEPLRLAEEYDAYFGKRAVYDLIKKEIDDAAWLPGELHRTLLELPWSEVLTTNWDTLLERAATEINKPLYSAVSKQEDLSGARSPRIAKLHGTVGLTENLIFTQEDYRKYPQNYAAFVNFARQVFIENELCLLGFSGDDPNFLQWSGWVRDNLHIHSRRIYLVGALGLNSAKRKYLESINIAPIDLASLVVDCDDDDKHSVANKIFLEELKNLKPKQSWEWKPRRLHDEALKAESSADANKGVGRMARFLEEKALTLELDHLSYPGWLVCPFGFQWDLQSQINDPVPTTERLAVMEREKREKLLYEIAWRCHLLHEVISLPMAKELLSICDSANPNPLSKKQQGEIALWLMRNSRWFDDAEVKSIENAAIEILTDGSLHFLDGSNEVFYHRAICARDSLDYLNFEENANKIIADSPMWKMRKASLLADLEKDDDGRQLLRDAYNDLVCQYRKDRKSVYIISRLAWADWLLRGVDYSFDLNEINAFSFKDHDLKFDPWNYVNRIRERVDKELDRQRRQQTIEPLFEPGHYRDNSRTVVVSNEVSPFTLLDGVSNLVGIPLRWGHTNFFVDQAAKLAELEDVGASYRFSLAIRAANDDRSDVLNKVFSRMQIACLSQQNVDLLLNNCLREVAYWCDRCAAASGNRNGAIGRLQVFTEVLARVVVRTDSGRAKDAFRLAVSIGKKSELHHFCLCDPLARLLDFSIEAIPESQHHELLLDALSFPLQQEVGSDMHGNWPSPIINVPGNRVMNVRLDRRLDEIIDFIEPISQQSAFALERLLPLIEKDFLSEKERKKIASKIWGVVPVYDKLPDVGLLKHALTIVPSEDPLAVESIFKHYLFEQKAGGLFSREVLLDLINAAVDERMKLFPSSVCAIDYFDRLVAWNNVVKRRDLHGIKKRDDSAMMKLIGKALAKSIVPALPREALNLERFESLYAFYTKNNIYDILPAFVYFAVTNDELSDRTQRIVKEALYSKKDAPVVCSSYAILKWRDLQKSAIVDSLVLRFIRLIESSRITDHPGLLWTAKEMCEKGYLSDVDKDSLGEIIPVIFDGASYDAISSSIRESVTASLLRKGCVVLAKSILSTVGANRGELDRVLNDARHDPLPEVRFSL